jgi:acetyl esterase/lipase
VGVVVCGLGETRLDHAKRHRIAGVRCVWIDKQDSSEGSIVYLHGGSYVTGPIKLQWNWLATLAKETGTAALAIDYSLAPEHAYPIAHNESVAVMKAILSSASGPVFLIGGSTGGRAGPGGGAPDA